MIKLKLILLSVFFLNGCGSWLETPYSKPEVLIPEGWDISSQNTIDDVGNIRADWWEAFHDPALNALIEKALANNPDLALATITVKRSQLQADLTNTNLTPDVGASGEGSVTKKLRDENAHSVRHYNTALTLNYELDLWGKLARTRDMAAWQATADVFDMKSTRLSLIGTTATLYWTIAELNSRLHYSSADIEAAQKNIVIISHRFNAGSVGYADLALAQQNKANLQAIHQQILQQRESNRKALAILLSEVVTSDMIEHFALLTSHAPNVFLDVPAKVLANRPDVAAAEAKIRRSLASHDAKKASFYPNVSLTGSVNGSDSILKKILRDPTGVLGIGINLPFLQWNTMQLEVGISQTEFEAAIISYRKIMYQAFAEVNEALLLQESLKLEYDNIYVSLKEAEKVEAISAARYRFGKNGLRFWLDDQKSLRDAKLSVLSLRSRQLKSQLLLYQALGGVGNVP